MQADDSYWRRPEPSPVDRTGFSDPSPPDFEPRPGSPPGPGPRLGSASHSASPPSAGSGTYHGPPPTTPPPAGWRPDHIVEPPPPRRLPPQDHRFIDQAEARARTLTRAAGIAVGVILVVMLCALCGRALA